MPKNSKKEKTETEVSGQMQQRVMQKFFTPTGKYTERQKAYLDTDHVWEDDEDGYINIFAADYGTCNGPVCTKCGYDKCHHCNPKPLKKCVA
jgi:hypothetical protein